MSEYKTQRLNIAAVEQVVSRKRVAEQVTPQTLDTGSILKLAKNEIDRIYVKRLPEPIEEKSVNLFLPAKSYALIIDFKQSCSIIAQRDEPFFSSLTLHKHTITGKIDVAAAEPCCLSSP